ncbi:hypothetical protein HDE_13457 [Halotydeus destructor]|nr:hypothetical protein HDE_13457 [Halotydeus destructor]
MLVLLSSLVLLKLSTSVHSGCGNPGLPQGGKFLNSEHTHRKTNFEDGAEVSIICKRITDILLPNGLQEMTSFNGQYFTRKCVHGSWTNHIPSCAKKLDVGLPDLMPSRIVHQIDCPQNSTNCSDQLSGLKTIHLSNTTLFSYFEITITADGADVLNFEHNGPISAVVAESRQCSIIKKVMTRLDFHCQQVLPTTGNGTSLIYNGRAPKLICDTEKDSFRILIGFHCPLINAIETNMAVASSDRIELNYQHCNATKLDIVGLDLYHPGQFSCQGPPEVQLHGSYINKRYFRLDNETTTQAYSFGCAQGYRPVFKDHHLPYNGSICGIDGQFDQELPHCEPEVTCHLLNDSKEFLIKYTDVYMHANKTYATKDTKASFHCRNNDTVYGTSRTICKSDGQWAPFSPKCLPFVQDGFTGAWNYMTSHTNLAVIIIILVLSLIIVICCSFIACMYYGSIRPRTIGSLEPIYEEQARYEKVAAHVQVSWSSSNASNSNRRSVIIGDADIGQRARHMVTDYTSNMNMINGSTFKQAPKYGPTIRPIDYPLVDNAIYNSTDELHI